MSQGGLWLLELTLPFRRVTVATWDDCIKVAVFEIAKENSPAVRLKEARSTLPGGGLTCQVST